MYVYMIRLRQLAASTGCLTGCQFRQIASLVCGLSERHSMLKYTKSVSWTTLLLASAFTACRSRRSDYNSASLSSGDPERNAFFVSVLAHHINVQIELCHINGQIAILPKYAYAVVLILASWPDVTTTISEGTRCSNSEIAPGLKDAPVAPLGK